MIKRILLLAGFYLLLLGAAAQPGSLDLSFNPQGGIPITSGNAYVGNALAVQNDGKILVGGTFPQFDSTANTLNLARLLPDGNVDTSFHLGFVFNYNVHAITIQRDGKILVGGDMAYPQPGTKFITRLNSDGSVDTTFASGTGCNGDVNAITIQPDNKILIGGGFTSYNGNTCGNIARLNTDGTFDTTFNCVPGAIGNGLQCILVRPDNKIVIGGDFTNYDNDTLFRIALLNPDGTGVPYYNQLGGFDKAVRSLVLMYDTSTIVAGDFTSWDLQPDYNKLARITATGTLLPNFNPGSPGPAPDLWINAALRDNNNRIIIGGNFNAFGGQAYHIAAVDSLARFDTTFAVGTGSNNPVQGMAKQTNGKILITGSFTSYNGITRNGIARLYNCTTPQPGPITGDTIYSCPGQLTYSISAVAGANSYVWSLPNGWTGSSDSTSITVTATDTGGVISVIAFGDSCGNSAPQTLTVQRQQLAAIPVCEVTVDSMSQYNIVIWDKPQTNMIDSFFIYRQDSTFTFNKIAAVPYGSLSEFNDTASAANPNSTAHQYKISFLDTCGIESELSPYHETIFLQNLGGGNLLWSPYQIENAVNPVIYYRVYRDTLGNGDFVPLNTIIPGGNTSYTDVDAAQYPNAYYVLDVNWSISCNPTRAVSTSRSNIRTKPGVIPVGFEGIAGGVLTIFPNPANRKVSVNYSGPAKATSLQIEDLLGVTVYQTENMSFGGNQQTKQISVEGLAKGVYIVSVSTDKGRIMKKLVIQ